MSRRTIKITAPNGASVRTVHSKRLFVVNFGDQHVKYVPNEDPFVRGEHVRLDPPVPFARVVKRTDSYVAANRELVRNSGGATRYAVYATWTDDNLTPAGRFLTPIEVASRADSEKSRKAFAARVGNNGPARSLFY